MVTAKQSALLLAASLLLSSPACAQRWAAYTSDNFTLYSDATDDEVRALVENFEIFRLTTLSVLRLPNEPESRRPLIVVYDNTRDFRRVSPRPNIVGFFYSSIFGPRMLVRPPKSGAVQQVLFHEYVHYLLSQRSTLNYPHWYHEGLASMLQTVAITSSSIRVGDAPAYYDWAIRLGFDAFVHDVVDLDAKADRGFYLTAWLMTHYFLLGEPARWAQTSDYLRRYDAGEDPIEAFTASYGISPTAMNREVEAYARRYVIPALTSPKVPYTGMLSKRALAPDEALLLLASIAVERDELDAAHRYFDEAEALEAESLFRANLMGRRAIAYIHDGRVVEGDELIGRLIEQATEDPQVLGDITHYAYDKFVEIRMKRSDGSEAAELERAVDYGLRAVAADPRNMEAHYYLGLSYEQRGELQRAADALLAGYEIDSSAPRLNMDFARVLIKGGQHELASYLVSRVYSATHSDDERAALRDIIQDLETREVDFEKHWRLLPSWQHPTRRASRRSEEDPPQY